MSLSETIWYTIQKPFAINHESSTKNWFLVSSPIPLFTIMVIYLFFCTYCGPRFMEKRKPYQLKDTLKVYNALQVALSIYLFVGGFLAGWYKDYSYTCQPVDYSDSPGARTMNHLAWWYYFAKITELLDTVFFILRKKYNQVTFLHVYHHTIMPLFSYMGVRYYPNGHGTLFGVINSFVHIIMYSYYLIAGLGPQYQKYLWWKKHVTTIQLIQFALIFLHNFPPLFTDCAYPKGLNALLVCEASVFLYLFGKFYVKSYTNNKQKKSDLNGSSKNGVTEKIKTNSIAKTITNGKPKLRRD